MSTHVDAVIRYVNQHGQHVVFMLWGAYAQKKGAVVDRVRVYLYFTSCNTHHLLIRHAIWCCKQVIHRRYPHIDHRRFLNVAISGKPMGIYNAMDVHL